MLEMRGPRSFSLPSTHRLLTDFGTNSLIYATYAEAALPVLLSEVGRSKTRGGLKCAGKRTMIEIPTLVRHLQNAQRRIS